jgi:hypothetical protein
MAITGKEIFIKMVNSKEYSELAKCFTKNCPKFIKYQEEHTAATKELLEIEKLKKIRRTW